GISEPVEIRRAQRFMFFSRARQLIEQIRLGQLRWRSGAKQKTDAAIHPLVIDEPIEDWKDVSPERRTRRRRWTKLRIATKQIEDYVAHRDDAVETLPVTRRRDRYHRRFGFDFLAIDLQSRSH